MMSIWRVMKCCRGGAFGRDAAGYSRPRRNSTCSRPPESPRPARRPERAIRPLDRPHPARTHPTQAQNRNTASYYVVTRIMLHDATPPPPSSPTCSTPPMTPSYSRKYPHAAGTSTLCSTPSATPLLTFLPVLAMVRSTVAYSRDGSATTEAVWLSRETS